MRKRINNRTLQILGNGINWKIDLLDENDDANDDQDNDKYDDKGHNHVVLGLQAAHILHVDLLLALE